MSRKKRLMLIFGVAVVSLIILSNLLVYYLAGGFTSARQVQVLQSYYLATVDKN